MWYDGHIVFKEKGTKAHDERGSLKNILRLRRLPGRTGAGHRRAAGRAGRAGHHAHWGGEIDLLPDSGPAAAGHHPGGLAAGVPDAGPGDGAGADGHPGGVFEQRPDIPSVSTGSGPGQGRTVQDHLCGAGAAGDRGLSLLCGARGHLLGRCGRGPLHLPVGPGLPALLSEYPGVRGVPAPAAGGGGLYRHGHPGCERGHRKAAAAAGASAPYHWLQPGEPVF